MQMTQTEKAIIEPHKLPLSANGMVDGGWQLDLKIKKKKKKKNQLSQLRAFESYFLTIKLS